MYRGNINRGTNTQVARVQAQLLLLQLNWPRPTALSKSHVHSCQVVLQSSELGAQPPINQSPAVPMYAIGLHSRVPVYWTRHPPLSAPDGHPNPLCVEQTAHPAYCVYVPHLLLLQTDLPATPKTRFTLLPNTPAQTSTSPKTPPST